MRIHLAGDAQARDCATIVGHPNVLASYLHLRSSKRLDDRWRAFDPDRMILDSGLFSFMFGSKRGEIPETYEAYRDFTLRYLDDVARLDWPGVIVEADVHKLLGMEALWKLRELFKPLGDRVMYAWHVPEGIEGLRELARRYSYIALSVPELRIAFGGTHRRGTDAYKRAAWALLAEARAACKVPPRIHLLGCTVPELMETSLAWSCDSTSWMSGAIYNNPTWGFLHGELRKFQPLYKHADRVAWNEYRRRIADRYGIEKEGEKTLVACADAFAQYQRRLDSRYTVAPTRTQGEDR